MEWSSEDFSIFLSAITQFATEHFSVHWRIDSLSKKSEMKWQQRWENSHGNYNLTRSNNFRMIFARKKRSSLFSQNHFRLWRSFYKKNFKIDFKIFFFHFTNLQKKLQNDLSRKILKMKWFNFSSFSSYALYAIHKMDEPNAQSNFIPKSKVSELAMYWERYRKFDLCADHTCIWEKHDHFGTKDQHVFHYRSPSEFPRDHFVIFYHSFFLSVSLQIVPLIYFKLIFFPNRYGWMNLLPSKCVDEQ